MALTSGADIFMPVFKPQEDILSIHGLSLRFNGHFPGEPGLANVYRSKG